MEDLLIVRNIFIGKVELKAFGSEFNHVWSGVL